jgi:hypothetical protein
MIDAGGWFDWALRDPGPADRATYMGGAPTAMTAIIHHSMEGLFSPVNGGDGYNVMRDRARFPTAWHGTVTRAGVLWQHYPVTARLVHAHAGNVRGPGFESEGFAPEPLTAAQVRTWRRIHADIAAFVGRPFTRVPGSGVGLVEHREVGPTACPSERYAPLWAAIAGDDEEEEAMSDDDLLALFAGSEETDESGALLSREERLKRARFRRDEAAAGRAPSVRELALRAAQANTWTVPDHVHDLLPFRTGRVVTL